VFHLGDLLAGNSHDIDLDLAALELATIEFPDLPVAEYRGLLDSYAAELRERLGSDADGPFYIAETNRYLFEELGFRGNQEDYYNPRNSCLNEVLTSRTGIPITLSIVYMEIARRLDKPVQGIGLPGHFLVEYNDGDFSAFLDPFNGGRFLATKECYELAQRASGIDFSSDPSILLPVTKRQILLRMLNNLRTTYIQRHSFRKALQVLDLVVAAGSASADDYKQRAVVRLQLHQLRDAKDDFEHCLRLIPESGERAAIEKHLRSLERWLAQMN
jgi:regulator of sirC expression with transglutaminase-like and TPR domain